MLAGEQPAQSTCASATMGHSQMTLQYNIFSVFCVSLWLHYISHPKLDGLSQLVAPDNPLPAAHNIWSAYVSACMLVVVHVSMVVLAGDDQKDTNTENTPLSSKFTVKTGRPVVLR